MELPEKHFCPQLQILRWLPFPVPGLAPPEILMIHLLRVRPPWDEKKRVGITVDYFRWIETEKSWSRHKTRCSASDVDEVYDLTVFLPCVRGESHPTSNLRTRSIKANSGAKG